MPIAVSETIQVLARIVQGVPIGTNLGFVRRWIWRGESYWRTTSVLVPPHSAHHRGGHEAKRPEETRPDLSGAGTADG